MADSEKRLQGHILDVINRQIIDGELHIKDGKIVDMVPKNNIDKNAPYIMPGLIDSHVHIESSMLLPSNYAKAAVKHGVIGCVCDPHEIANVCGLRGINFMIENSKSCHFYFAFSAPGCVPATSFETSGFAIKSNAIKKLLDKEEVFALAEMMNFPGVINDDSEVLKKIQIAKELGKPIDGHAPMLSGEHLEKYVKIGISTDHECRTLQEAEEKIHLGMKILIREGSAAKNFESLCPLIEKYPQSTMFCADDIHPDELQNYYINDLVKRSLQKGFSIWDILQTSSLNPILYYHLSIGLLQKNDSADFIIIDNLQDFNILSTFIKGQCVFSSKDNSCDDMLADIKTALLPNNFHTSPISETDIEIKAQSTKIKVIKAKDKELYTQSFVCQAKIENNNVVSDTENDVLKMVVCSRYTTAKPSIAFIQGFNLKKGALASSIAHDSHNIIALGITDHLIVKAINQIIESKGGICVVDDSQTEILALPCGGLISDKPIDDVAGKYELLNNFAKQLGCTFNAPFMTMAFMSLLVIPELKLSDKGLFDVNSFTFTNLFIQ